MSAATATKKSPPDYSPYEPHPAANVFPLMKQDDLQRLAADIKAFGQLEHIEILADTNQIVDGRNRYLACRLAGVEPRITRIPMDGMPYGIYEYVVSKNLLRRQLTSVQRKAVIKTLREGGHSIRAIAELTGIPVSTVGRNVQEMSQSGQMDQPERIEGKDGRSRPASRPKAEDGEDGEDATKPILTLVPGQEIAPPSPKARPAGMADRFWDSIRTGNDLARVTADLKDDNESLSTADIDQATEMLDGQIKSRQELRDQLGRIRAEREPPEPSIPVDGNEPSSKQVNDWLRSVGRESEATRGRVSNALKKEYLLAAMDAHQS